MPAVARAAAVSSQERVLRLYNTHTGESIKSVFWVEGNFIPTSLKDLNGFLRDHRCNSIANIDPNLLLLIAKVGKEFASGDLIHVISCYRSPESNAKLAKASGGVAKHSLHMDGKAMDIRVPGHDLAKLRRFALNLGAGGVGYYPKSQFVHMDTGRVRQW